MTRAILLLISIAFASMSLAPHAAAAPRLLVLDFEMVDTSNEPIDRQSEHAQRLRLIRDSISDELAARKIYAIVDRERVRAELDALLEHQFLHSCNGCELPLSRSAGADLVMFGKFTKVSTLIGSMDVSIKDANTGAIVYARTFGFRGDTEEAWLRAARFFVDGLSAANGRTEEEVAGRKP